MKTTGADTTKFSLKHASAARAAEVLRAAYPEGQIRVTTDQATNSVIVQASPAVTQEVARLLEALDGKKDATDTPNPFGQPRRN
jgi:type II secretory pathway component GspD/PulD (secretin)